jgi:hypothetical protein
LNLIRKPAWWCSRLTAKHEDETASSVFWVIGDLPEQRSGRVKRWFESMPSKHALHFA